MKKVKFEENTSPGIERTAKIISGAIKNDCRNERCLWCIPRLSSQSLGYKKNWRSNLGRNCNGPMKEGHKAKGRTKGHCKNGSRCRTRETINGKTGAAKQCAGHI